MMYKSECRKIEQRMSEVTREDKIRSGFNSKQKSSKIKRVKGMYVEGKREKGRLIKEVWGCNRKVGRCK